MGELLDERISHIPPACLAAECGHDSILTLFPTDNEEDVNSRDSEDYTALVRAVREEHASIVKLLVDQNADINAQGGEYGNALQAAAYGGHLEVIKLLLASGAQVNAQGGDYSNALQAAASEGQQDSQAASRQECRRQC
ncbi:Hypothetical protein D9617_118g092440 [Elsinoe fawcettii]|nr:Hypothetical protein D9617_118g092440 [Elsinoe fawcettii]